jgi:hypothetical protein
MKGNRYLVAALGIEAIMIIGLWSGGSPQTARAEIPDMGAQNVQIIQLLQANNQKLDKIIDLMQGGTLQVHIAKSDDKSN